MLTGLGCATPIICSQIRDSCSYPGVLTPCLSISMAFLQSLQLCFFLLGFGNPAAVLLAWVVAQFLENGSRPSFFFKFSNGAGTSTVLTSSSFQQRLQEYRPGFPNCSRYGFRYPADEGLTVLDKRTRIGTHSKVAFTAPSLWWRIPYRYRTEKAHKPPAIACIPISP